MNEIKEYTEKHEILCKINKVSSRSAELPYEFVLYQGLPKSDKFETIIQKCTELGVSAFVPVQMERSVVKITDEKENKKLERWNKIAAEASKQCRRQKIPVVNRVINFENIIENISKYIKKSLNENFKINICTNFPNRLKEIFDELEIFSDIEGRKRRKKLKRLIDSEFIVNRIN